jgi:histidinol-phosphate aminotransferase
MASFSQPFSRRGFAKIVGLGVAASVGLKPQLAAARAILDSTDSTAITDLQGSQVVRLSSNESAYGPSPAIFDAMQHAFTRTWRYPEVEEEALIADLATFHGVNADYILLANGSSEILSLCVAAFAGPEKPVAIADPTFEAISFYAEKSRANVIKVPLTAKYWHDLEHMLSLKSGLAYICNPNNPTATITPESEVQSFLVRLPATTVVVIDEAYAHYPESRDYASAISKVKDHPNLIVTRTFSKLYGLAGLRCGYAIAQPATIRLLRAQQSWDSLNIMALVAARSSLKDTKHVEKVLHLTYKTKTFALSRLKSMGYYALPSETNFLMANLRQDVGPVIDSLRTRGVEVGRRCAKMPNFLRVTIGTRPQMEVFLSALGAILT